MKFAGVEPTPIFRFADQDVYRFTLSLSNGRLSFFKTLMLPYKDKQVMLEFSRYVEEKAKTIRQFFIIVTSYPRFTCQARFSPQ